MMVNLFFPGGKVSIHRLTASANLSAMELATSLSVAEYCGLSLCATGDMEELSLPFSLRENGKKKKRKKGKKTILVLL